MNSRFGPGDMQGHETSPSPLTALARMLYDTAEKKCAVIQILNAEWEAAAGWESTKESAL